MYLCRCWISGERFRSVFASEALSMLESELPSWCIIVSTRRSKAVALLTSLRLGRSSKVQQL